MESSPVRDSPKTDDHVLVDDPFEKLGVDSECKLIISFAIFL